MGNVFESFIAGLKGASPQEPAEKPVEKIEYAVVSTAESSNTGALSKLPFALAIIALILGFVPSFSLSGVTLGACAVITLYCLRRGNIQIAYDKAVAIIAACAMLFGAFCACSYASLSMIQPAPEQDPTSLASTYQPESDPEEATFTLEVANPIPSTANSSAAASANSDSGAASPTNSKASSSSGASNSSSASASSAATTSAAAPEAVTVNVTGTTQDGMAVTGTLECVPGKPRELTLGPGTYTFAFDAIAMPDGETFYKAASTTCTFTGDDSTAARLELALDAEKIDQAKAEKEAAAAAAEAARQAEAAKAQAAAAAANEYTVYVANTGSKYHRSGCQYLKKSQNAISISSAKAQGYTPCSRCNP